MSGGPQIEDDASRDQITDPGILADHLGRSARAIQAAQPAASRWDCEIAALRASSEIPGFDLEMLGPVETQASEHLLWLSEDHRLVIKATAYGRFGHDFDRRRGGAYPTDYLERMALANEIFGDTVRIVGKFEQAEGGPGLLLAQDFVIADKSTPNPSEQQIEAFLREKGFAEIPESPRRYRNAKEAVEVDDTHPGNFILTKGGKLVPIDLLVRRVLAERRVVD